MPVQSKSALSKPFYLVSQLRASISLIGTAFLSPHFVVGTVLSLAKNLGEEDSGSPLLVVIVGSITPAIGTLVSGVCICVGIVVSISIVGIGIGVGVVVIATSIAVLGGGGAGLRSRSLRRRSSRVSSS